LYSVICIHGCAMRRLLAMAREGAKWGARIRKLGIRVD
jgi:hypothetical protein